jgi:hypothetical protein
VDTPRPSPRTNRTRRVPPPTQGLKVHWKGLEIAPLNSKVCLPARGPEHAARMKTRV